MTYDKALVRWAENKLTAEGLNWLEVWGVGILHESDPGEFIVNAYIEFDNGEIEDETGGEWEFDYPLGLFAREIEVLMGVAN